MTPQRLQVFGSEVWWEGRKVGGNMHEAMECLGLEYEAS